MGNLVEMSVCFVVRQPTRPFGVETTFLLLLLLLPGNDEKWKG